MVRCKKCGYLFQNQDECPSCGYNITDEMEECVFCGKLYAEPNILNRVCKDCLKEHATVDTALGYGERYTHFVELNGFVAYFLGQDRINEILEKYVRNSNEETLKKDALVFLTDDPDCYTLFLNDVNEDPDGVKVRSKLHKRAYKRR